MRFVENELISGFPDSPKHDNTAVMKKQECNWILMINWASGLELYANLSNPNAAVQKDSPRISVQLFLQFLKSNSYENIPCTVAKTRPRAWHIQPT